MENPTYLGDAVYALHNGFQIELKLNSHESETVLVLEPEVLSELNKFAAGFIQQKPTIASAKHKPAVIETLAARKSQLEDEINQWIQCASILDKLPDNIVPKCHVVCGMMMIYSATREDVVAIMSSLSAGKWSKELHSSTTLTYRADVDGIHVEIYNVPPPESCKIVEEEVEVPAHTTIKRTLVCK